MTRRKAIRRRDNPPANPSPKEDSPQTAPPETLLLQKLLGEAWALRDRVEDRRPPDGWSPVDYAPHLRREYQALLLGYEWRSRAGAAFDAKALADDLQSKVLPLGDVSADKPAPPEVARWSVLDRLFAARREFLAAGVDTRFQGPPEQVRAVRDMIRLKNDLVFSRRTTPHGTPGFGRPRRVPTGSIGRFWIYWGHWRRSPTNSIDLEAACLSGESPAAVQQRLDDLALRARRLDELRSSVEGSGLQKDAADLADAAEKEPQKKGLATSIDALLSVPLLPAELHTRLLAARAKLDQPLRVPAEESAARAGGGFVAGQVAVGSAARPVRARGPAGAIGRSTGRGDAARRGLQSRRSAGTGATLAAVRAIGQPARRFLSGIARGNREKSRQRRSGLAARRRAAAGSGRCPRRGQGRPQGRLGGRATAAIAGRAVRAAAGRNARGRPRNPRRRPT